MNYFSKLFNLPLFLEESRWRLPRVWSNRELRKFSPLFKGDIINVSAFKDRDKEGHLYREYFKNVTNYFCSNYFGATEIDRGYQGNIQNEIELDLCKPLAENLKNRFDVVFNHTTLEHVFDVRMAFNNLCDLSKDIVILVVPFSQAVHEEGEYGDYWRFCPGSINRLFTENGFEVLYNSATPVRNSAIYLFYIATRDSAKWGIKFSKNIDLKKTGDWIGHSYLKTLLLHIKCWANPDWRSRL